MTSNGNIQKDIYKDMKGYDGLKKASRSLDSGRLPSNFSYTMMKKINEKVLKEEKKREKRLFISMVLVCIGMIGSCSWIIWMYLGNTISEKWNKVSLWFRNININDGYIENITFYLPIFISLIILFFLDRYLRKKIRDIINTD